MSVQWEVRQAQSAVRDAKEAAMNVVGGEAQKRAVDCVLATEDRLRRAFDDLADAQMGRR